jgi:hypothetical protein
MIQTTFRHWEGGLFIFLFTNFCQPKHPQGNRLDDTAGGKM